MRQLNTDPDPTLEAFINVLTGKFDLQVLFALPVYGLTLSALEGGKPAEPEQIGWRAVTVDRGRSLVASEIPTEWKDAPAVSFTRGSIVEQSLKAFRLLSREPAVRAAFPRQLRVSALRLDTLWLKKTDEAQKAIVDADVIVPFTRFPLEDALKLQDGKTFLRDAREAAERRRFGKDRAEPKKDRAKPKEEAPR